jgi:hypothetical protein
VIRPCASCGASFETDRDYHRYCWPCFREESDRGRWTDEKSSSWRKPPPGWERTAPPPPPRPPTPQLDARFLRDALQLCHPDRHPVERAKSANAVTATLLELLHAQRRR